MLIVAGTFEVAPSDREAFLESRRSIVDQTRAEPGCLEYAFSADLSDPGTVRVFERWASADALDAHLEIVQARSQQPSPITVLGRNLSVYEAGEGAPLGGPRSAQSK